MPRVQLDNILAVGMHHHGSRELHMGYRYKVWRESDNPVDANACAIVDCDKVVAYLDRSSASCLSKIVAEGLLPLKTSKIYIEPIYRAEVKSRKRGPQHTCFMIFVAREACFGRIKELALSSDRPLVFKAAV